jgi:MYXO-CTERM domain-containing protein
MRARVGGRALAANAAATTVVAAVIGALVAFAAAPAQAYVRYLTDTGQPFHWAQTCVPLVGFPNDLPEMTPDQINTAATAAAAVWSADGLPCTYMRINVEMSSRPTVRAKFDSANYLIFRSDSWCRQGDKAGTCTNYDPSALAITSVFVNTKDGRIRDGDIEVNAKYFVWANLDASNVPGDPRDLQDLQNALTHEMGHLIGLDHTCFGGGDRPRPNDNTGQPAPDCDKASPAIRETTMFASADKGDISKRTLATDDQLAVCEIYPVAQDPLNCPVANLLGDSGGGCGCAAAGGAGGKGRLALLAAAALALGTALSRRRRRRCRRKFSG